MKSSRVRDVFISLCVAAATLAVLEVFLRVADFAELRDTLPQHSLGYDYDSELGWMPARVSSDTARAQLKTR